jgi:hypothetical protein
MCYSGLCPAENHMSDCTNIHNLGMEPCPIIITTLKNKTGKPFTVVYGYLGDWDPELSKSFDDEQEALDYEDALKMMQKLTKN